ncbi:MAG: hypothetical protein HRU46_00185 [Verrucomicrobiales bacterium]|nr:hypothetical protein [Verrucomicrobiales bacterium]
MQETPPVLLLLFNRPDLAEKVFERVREARPARLFISVDGARADREEKDLVDQNRALANKVDWPCEVETRFHETNQGCGTAVSGAITWFFSHVESGVILEDDCLPEASFFPFCAELLDRFAGDESVMMINGTSYIPTEIRPEESYYFSMFDQVWGWASWRRAWNQYDFTMPQWPKHPNVQASLKELSLLNRLARSRFLNRLKAGEIDTWDFQWEIAIWANLGKVITPRMNLISNLGFDGRATHTSKGDDGRAERETGEVTFPLKHPDNVEVDQKLDRWLQANYMVSPAVVMQAAWRRIRRVLGGK